MRYKWAGKNHRVVYIFGDVFMHHKQENFEGVFLSCHLMQLLITRFRSLVEVVFCWLQFLRSVLLIRFVYMNGLVYYAQATSFHCFNSKLSKCDNLSKIRGHWWIKPLFILISRISKIIMHIPHWKILQALFVFFEVQTPLRSLGVWRLWMSSFFTGSYLWCWSPVLHQLRTEKKQTLVARCQPSMVSSKSFFCKRKHP